MIERDYADHARAGLHGPASASPHGAGPAAHRSVSALQVLAAVLESWRLIAITAIVASTLVLGYVLSRDRTYTARTALATVSGRPSSGLAGSALAAGLLGGGSVGIEASPSFVLRLMQTDTVLRQVATSPVPGTNEMLIARVAGGETLPPREEFAPTINRLIDASIERETGTIRLSVTHQDTGVVRLVVARLIEATTSAFAHASRAQATQLRQAQEKRLETAAQNLRSAEERLVRFMRANRSVPPFSELYVQQQQLQRAVMLAENTYTRVAAEHESAVAKELEETPALVVLDPVADRIPGDPRRTVLKVIVTAFASALLAALFAIMRALFLESGATEERDRVRLRAAVRGLPLIGRALVRS